MKIGDQVTSKINVHALGLKKNMIGKVFSCNKDGVTYQILFDKLKDRGSICIQIMDLEVNNKIN